MKKLLRFGTFNLIFNLCLLIFLFLGIQNSNKKSKVNFYLTESVPLPLSFILGSSFIAGSISYSIINLIFKTEQNKNNHKESKN